MASVPSPRSSWRRTGALTAVVLTTAGLAALPGGTATAAPGPAYDGAPAAAAATWLGGQLDDDHLLRYQGQFGPTTDHGLTIDAALALQAVGGHAAAVDEIGSAIASTLGTYAAHDSYEDDWTDPENPVQIEADRSNASAKALALLAITDEGSATVDELVTKLEGLTIDAGPAAGRITDGATRDGVPAPDLDYANAFGQAFAARGLAAVGSDEADEALTYLLSQQCDTGFVRFTLPQSDAATQACTTATPGKDDLDATALTVVSLIDQHAEPAVASALDDATDWLISQQSPNGGFGSTAAPNGNSTGLVGWALGAYGAAANDAAATSAAAKAATWLRRHQATAAGTCTTYAASDRGAVAYEELALTEARQAPITPALEGQWLRATAQAIPALTWAPKASTALGLTGATDYVRAGSTQTLRISGLAPGETACVAGHGVSAEVQAGDGSPATKAVTLPAGTGDRTYTLTGAAGTTTTTFRALGAVSPTVKAAKKLRKGTKVTVKVTGLAAQEKVSVTLRGKRVDSGRTNDQGVFKARFKVKGKPGRTKLSAVGQFPDRERTKKVKVV